jgi:hypothetical protein
MPFMPTTGQPLSSAGHIVMHSDNMTYTVKVWAHSINNASSAYSNDSAKNSKNNLLP